MLIEPDFFNERGEGVRGIGEIFQHEKYIDDSFGEKKSIKRKV